MDRLLRVLIVAVLFSAVPIAAHAQERLGDGVMGALAGALVAGPVGAVVGGGIGYMAGPHIANRISGDGHHRRSHRATRRRRHS